MSNLEPFIEKIQQSLDPTASLLNVDQRDVPHHWAYYLSTSSAERQVASRNEIAMFSDYFPRTATGLRHVITDAFLAHTQNYGVCRFFVRQLEGKHHLAYSRAPKTFAQTPHDPSWETVKKQAPTALTYIYEKVMDGLTDLYGYAGPKPSLLLSTVEDEIDTYAELGWYDAFAKTHNPSNVIEIFASGGGAYLLLDLNQNLTNVFEPQAYLASTKNPKMNPSTSVDFFPYIDQWMAIGLAQYDE